MNTNNLDANGLPDAEYLQKLANQFFAAYPGDYTKPVEQKTPSVETQHLASPESSEINLSDPFGPVDSVPNSMGGTGVSPSVFQQNQRPPGFQEPSMLQTNVETQHFASPEKGQNFAPPSQSSINPFGPIYRVPNSMSGLGISPSVLQENQREPALKNPLLSPGFQPDQEPSTNQQNPFGTINNVPKSMSGLGLSPGGLDGIQQNQIDLSLLDPSILLGQKSGIPDLGSSSSKNTQPDTKVPSSFDSPGVTSSELQKTQSDNDLTSSLNKAPESVPLDDFTKHSLHHVPYKELQPFEKELREILPAMHPFISTLQLPYVGAGLAPAQRDARIVERAPASGAPTITRPPFAINQTKNDFPILRERVNGRPLVWLDNAATTQKPKAVIDRLKYYYEHENSNIHRAAHELAARATDAYEGARKKVQRFMNAASANEIVFVRGATEAINLVAKSWGEQFLQKGDEIIVTHLEHHANIVPWQMLAAKKGVILKVVPVDDDGQVLLDEYAKLLGPKTRLVSFTHVSNALGTVTPAKRMADMAHNAGAKVLVDGAQSVSHMRTDVQFLDADWYVFSGHKIFAPTGIGVLYGKEELLNETQPWQGGGNMIADVTFEKTKFQNAPSRYEAGTGNIADAIGLGEALDYVTRIGIDAIQQYEHYLLTYATRLLKEIPGLRLIGTAPDKAGVMSFVLEGFKTEEVGVALNKEGIAVRSGHHCAQPILRRFGVESTVRPSLALYNTCSNIDALISALHQLRGGRGF